MELEFMDSIDETCVALFQWEVPKPIPDVGDRATIPALSGTVVTVTVKKRHFYHTPPAPISNGALIKVQFWCEVAR